MTAAPIRALTIRQPWATLIIAGIKDVENRSWSTRYRGPLAVHAAANPDRQPAATAARAHAPDGTEFPPRLVLGVVQLVDVVSDSTSMWAADGLYHWVLADPVRFDTPVTAFGRLGLWPFSPTVA